MKSVFTYFLCCIAFYAIAQSDSTQLCVTTFYSYEHALERANEITRLDLTNQNLKSIPNTIDSFKNLEVLRLSDNPLSSLPTNLGKLQNLKVLELQNIKIKDISEVFGVISQLKNLKYLNLQGNFLVFIPNSIQGLKSLRELHLANTNLEKLGSGIWQLDSLEVLDVSSNRLERIDEEIIYLTNLSQLDISFNDLKGSSIKNIAGLPNLKTLKYEGLKDIPFDIALLSEITSLDLSKSRLRSIPDKVKNLESLQELKINHPTSLDISALYTTFGAIDSLKSVEILHDKVATIPRGIGKMNQIESLKIGGEQLKEIPSDFKKLNQLEQLIITESPVLNWSSTFSKLAVLPKLERLSLADNKITELPKNIGQLRQITSLDLSFNQLESLPPTIQQLTNLTTLQLFGNEFSIEAIRQLQLWLPNCTIQHNTLEQPIVRQKEINPPLESVIVEQETYRVTAEQAQNIDIPTSNSKIIIPENAFLDKDGKVVTGEITITYREFNNPTDIFLSGIPMTIENDGKIETFQSAGMIEFRAEQDGQPVFPNPENLIEVEVETNQSQDGFNLYNWDEGNGEWVEQERLVERVEVEAVEDTGSTRFIASPTLPKEPKFYQSKPEFFGYRPKSNKKSYRMRNRKEGMIISLRFMEHKLRKDKTKHFDEAISLSEMPAIRRYNWVFEGNNKERKDLRKELGMTEYITHSYKSVISAERLKVWDVSFNELVKKKAKDVYFIPNFEADNYTMYLVRVSDTLKIPVYPEVQSENPTIIQKRNLRLHEKYSEKYDERATIWEASQKRQEQKTSEYEKLMEDYRNSAQFDNNQLGWQARQQLDRITKRKMGITEFGVINIDQILKKRGSRMLAGFVDENDEILEPTMVYILDFSNNAVLNVYNNNLYFDKLATMKIITVFEDGNVGIVSTQVFDKARQTIKNSDKRAIFTPRMININEHSPNEIREIIGM